MNGRTVTALLLALGLAAGAARPAEYPSVRRRVDGEAMAGGPVVVHVVVALCDNENQGIVKVPAQLGNGQDPKNNLYWGAMYGVKSFLTARAGWKQVKARWTEARTRPGKILDRVVLQRRMLRGRREIEIYVVAEAWDGSQIRSATMRYLRFAGGHAPEEVTVETSRGMKTLKAGGAAHLVCYVGHNGFMDFQFRRTPAPASAAEPRSAVALCCKSRDHFLKPLRRAGAEPLALTTGLMAPEAYVLDALIRSWAAGDGPEQILSKAAVAYNTHQKCGVDAARRLFSTGVKE